MKRRDFLKAGALGSVSLASQWPNLAKAFNPSGIIIDPIYRATLSIVQGATDETQTQFSISHALDQDLEFLVQTPSGEWIEATRKARVSPGWGSVIDRVFFKGLSLDINYNFVVLDAQSMTPLDSRSFRTLDLNKQDIKVALCSCMDDQRHDPKIWQSLFKQNPDAIFFIGDSVYCDFETKPKMLSPGPETLWTRYFESRETLEVYHLPRLIPIFATWDDHDFAENDVGKGYPFVAESQRNFLNYFPQEAEFCRGLERGPGVSSALTLGNHLFIFFDDRSYRAKRAKDDLFGHWGEAQELWALDLLSRHRGPSLIINGSQFFTKSAFKESVVGEHPLQFDRFIKRLKALKTKAFFASGDVHFSEISDIETSFLGYKTLEVTSSSIHSYMFPGLPQIIRNPRRIALTTEKNFVLLQAAAVDFGCKLKIQSVSANDKVNFSRDFKII